MPTIAVTGTARSTPARNDPVRSTSQAATNAPTMYSEPCARLIMSMIPNTSVRPAASRNSIRPSCSPLSACSSSNRPDIDPRSLHRAFLHVRIAVIAEDRLAERLVHQPPLRVLAHDPQHVVLD